MRNQRMLEVSQYKMGLVDEWPGVDQLTKMLRRRSADLDCRDEEAFARFDALLDWILGHGRDAAGNAE